MKNVFNVRTKLLAILVSSIVLLSAVASSEVVVRPHVSAELVTEYQQAITGTKTTVALRLKPDPGWHVYWKYAGDFGAAPIFSWIIQDKAAAVPVVWPTPDRIESGPFTNYGYSDEVFFLAEIPAEYAGKPGTTIQLALDAEWLVCKEECIPGNALFAKNIPVVTEDEALISTAHTSKIQKTRAALPLTTFPSSITIYELTDSHLTLEFSQLHAPVTNAWFIPETPGFIKNGSQQILSTSENATQLTIPTSENRIYPESNKLRGLLFKDPPWEAGKTALEVSLPLERDVIHADAATTDAVVSYSFFLILIMAFIGGIILNIMPCVFPVLSIKVLGFVEHSHSSQKTTRAHALAFAAGVIGSFWLLTILVFFLRSTGEKVGWGFQLQNPNFVAVLYMVLILIACNLFGVFEVGSTLQRIGGNLDRGRADYTGSFLSGILTTVLATPCTAPFIGSAVAYALSGSFFENWLVFTCIALGLAAPYVLLSFFPIFLNYLPAPGAWMERFKQAMGFPILLTALWLLHVLESQTTPGTITILLLSSVGLLLAAWIFGITTQPRSSKRIRRIGQLVSFVIVIASGLISIPTHSAIHADAITQNGYDVDEYDQHWLHFSKDTITRQLQKGNPVFVDFTARWCVTCQVNKKLIFSSAEIRDLVKEKSIVLVRADWTRYDPVITDALKEHGKAGVPFNLLYIPNKKEPVEFPSLLTRGMIRESFKNL